LKFMMGADNPEAISWHASAINEKQGEDDVPSSSVRELPARAHPWSALDRHPHLVRLISGFFGWSPYDGEPQIVHYFGSSSVNFPFSFFGRSGSSP
jgi:hypothetical protein